MLNGATKNDQLLTSVWSENYFSIRIWSTTSLNVYHSPLYYFVYVWHSLSVCPTTYFSLYLLKLHHHLINYLLLVWWQYPYCSMYHCSRINYVLQSIPLSDELESVPFSDQLLTSVCTTACSTSFFCTNVWSTNYFSLYHCMLNYLLLYICLIN